jgi:putative oxidoreductase
MFNFSDNLRDAGYLILRVGIGFMIMMHGLPKILGGPDTWAFLGQQMGNLGITFFPVFWGFMAAITEFGGGILIMLGLFHRVSALLLSFTMLVAIIYHVTNGDPMMSNEGGSYSNALELGIVFLALFFIGPRKWAVDNLIWKKKK